MPRSDIGIALKALKWLVCCQRPLSLSELAVAIAIEPGALHFDEEKKLDDDALILTILGSLARQNPETAAVEISHFSVVEYLTTPDLPDGTLNRYYINDIEGHADLLHCCLTMLSFDPSIDDCFRAYAIFQWPLHAKKSDHARSGPLIEAFLSNPETLTFQKWRDEWEGEFDPNLRVNLPDSHFGLYYAALSSLPRAVETLLQSPEALKLSGSIALLAAARDGNEEVVDLLLKAKADLGARTALGWTVLHRAVYNRHISFVRKLVEAHVDVNIQDEDGWSPLHIAISEGYAEIAQVLVAHGANPSTQLKESLWTPLHLAAQQGMVDVAQSLVNAGASLTQLTDSAMTPLQIAVLHRQEKVFWLLVPKPAQQDFEGCVNELGKRKDIDRRVPRLSAIASTTSRV